MLTVQFMGLQLSRRTHVCMVDGEEVRMPRKEFEILFRLLSDRNRVFSRAELLSEVWPGETVVADRAVDVNVTRILLRFGPFSIKIFIIISVYLSYKFSYFHNFSDIFS